MNTSDTLGVIGILVSVLGIPLTYIIARRSRQRPDMRVAWDFTVLLRPDDDLLDRGLTMQFGTRPITRVSRTYLAIWNHRGDTIRGSDVATSDPLVVEVAEGDVVLKARVVRRSRRQTKICVRPDRKNPRVAPVEFEFLDAHDGAIFEVVHQGVEPATIRGTIQGTDIRRVGEIDLSAKALRSISLGRLRRFWTHASRALRLALFTSIAYVATFGMGIVAILSLLRGGKPELVAVDTFDLRTLAGQQKFADAVNRAAHGGPPLVLTAILIAFCLIQAVIAVIAVWRGSKVAIPPQIISEEVPPEETEAQGPNGGTSALAVEPQASGRDD